MNKVEAHSILREQVESYRRRSRSSLLELLSEQDTFTVRGESGVEYQLEFQAFWDERANGNLRVIGAIDDGGLRALAPFTADFILAPDGSFVGE